MVLSSRDMPQTISAFLYLSSFPSPSLSSLSFSNFFFQALHSNGNEVNQSSFLDRQRVDFAHTWQHVGKTFLKSLGYR